MDFSTIKTRDNIIDANITASLIVSLSPNLTENERDTIKNNLGSVWVPYTLGKDSVNSTVLNMEFYDFLLSYGVQGDVQGVIKYCSCNADKLRRDYNITVGKLFIRKYGINDPISKVISSYIIDQSSTITYDDYIQFTSQRGSVYGIGKDGIITLTPYKQRSTIYCYNGDVILKTKYCNFYNCIPISHLEYIDNGIVMFDMYGTEYFLELDDSGNVITGFENLPNIYGIVNKSIMDVYDIYCLLKHIKPDILIRDYNMDYKVINTLESILKIEVCELDTIVKYSNGHEDRFWDGIEIMNNGSVTLDGRTLLFKRNEIINFEYVEYSSTVDMEGYFIENVDENTIEVIGPSGAY